MNSSPSSRPEPTVDPSSVSSYHARLPYGQRMSASALIGQPFFPFDGEVGVVPLDEPVIPEPPRNGEPGGSACIRCVSPDDHLVWRDDLWSVTGGFDRIGLPAIVVLQPREHYRLDNLPEPLLASLGSVIQRVAGAIRQIDGVGRTHFNRWGDGSEHFHVWFLARPLGMMQLRGAGIAFWDDLLPDVPDDEYLANLRTIGAALAEADGEAFEPALSFDH
jgi:hypothetical protein